MLVLEEITSVIFNSFSGYLSIYLFFVTKLEGNYHFNQLILMGKRMFCDVIFVFQIELKSADGFKRQSPSAEKVKTRMDGKKGSKFLF